MKIVDGIQLEDVLYYALEDNGVLKEGVNQLREAERLGMFITSEWKYSPEVLNHIVLTAMINETNKEYV